MNKKIEKLSIGNPDFEGYPKLNKLIPTLHREVPMGSRVIIPAGYCHKQKQYGTVAGIASMHIIFHYIVILDEPINSEYGPQKAISIIGSLLEGENGENWKLDK